MNWSMYTADRTTHLKIVVVGLAAALLIAVIGISAQQFNLGTDILTAQAPTVDQGRRAGCVHRPQRLDHPLIAIFSNLPRTFAPLLRRDFFGERRLSDHQCRQPERQRRDERYQHQHREHYAVERPDAAHHLL